MLYEELLLIVIGVERGNILYVANVYIHLLPLRIMNKLLCGGNLPSNLAASISQELFFLYLFLFIAYDTLLSIAISFTYIKGKSFNHIHRSIFLLINFQQHTQVYKKVLTDYKQC